MIGDQMISNAYSTDAMREGWVPSGVPTLDSLLGGGLALGDNIVWVGEGPSETAPFVDAFQHSATGDVRVFDATGERGERTAGESREVTPEVLERQLLEGLRQGDRVVVSSLDDLVTRWGAAAAVDFYTRTCPRMFDRGAIAYWLATRERSGASVIDGVARVAQCVFEVRGGRLRVKKAEGRPLRVQGAVAEVDRSDERLVLHREHVVGRLGEGLRRLRATRGLNQRQLAQLAEVTPAAISQAESGRRGLSLDTLVSLCETLGVGVDEILGIGRPPSPWLARHDRGRSPGTSSVPLFDDPSQGARVHLVELAPGGVGRPPYEHKGPELLLAAEGLVLVDLGASTPVLRAGDALMVSDVAVQGWSNLAEAPSRLFWVAL
jgi:transcriptional regulator with XRE-family HTH domain